MFIIIGFIHNNKSYQIIVHYEKEKTFHTVHYNSYTSNGSWRQGIKGGMTCTVYVALVW